MTSESSETALCYMLAKVHKVPYNPLWDVIPLAWVWFIGNPSFAVNVICFDLLKAYTFQTLFSSEKLSVIVKLPVNSKLKDPLCNSTIF